MFLKAHDTGNFTGPFYGDRHRIYFNRPSVSTRDEHSFALVYIDF